MNGNKSDSRIFTGAEFLVNALHCAGVTHVFGGHGGSVVPLIDEIERHPSVTWVYCRCEVNASQAAAAYAKLHGRLGCCVATSGPGACHLLSGLVDADQDRVPVLCLTGTKDTGHVRHADFQDVDQGAIFRMAGLPFSETVSDVAQLMPLTRNAVTIAASAHRVCHLAIPVNVQQEELVGRSHFCLGTAYYQLRSKRTAPRLEVDTLVMALRAEIQSKRHVLIACGWRAAAHGLGQEVERLAELLGAPVVTSFDGKGAANESHPLAFGVVGVYGNAGTPASVDVLEDCDTIVSICVTDHTELVANGAGLQVRRLVQIEEWLLAGDALRFSPSALLSSGFLKETLKRVIAELERGLSISKTRPHRLSLVPLPPIGGLRRTSTGTHQAVTGKDVWDKLRSLDDSKPAGTPSTFLDLDVFKEDSHRTDSVEFCHPAVFFKALSETLDDDAVICADIGDNALWMAGSLAAKRGQRYLTSEHMGIMGYGVNAGLAASVSAAAEAKASVAASATENGGGPRRSRQTLVVAGDGGMQMSLNELATLRDHEASNVLVVVIVNFRLGRVQNETWGPGLKADGCSIGSPDFVKLFESYGYPDGTRLSTCDAETIRSAIEGGWAKAGKHGASVIELVQDPAVHPIMHKLSSTDRNRRSLTDWEGKTRSLRQASLFPEIETDHWKKHDTMLRGWLDGLTAVKKSEPFWLDSDEFASFSPSKAVQEQLDGLLDDAAPTLFETVEAHETFDSHFKSAFLNSFSVEVIRSVLMSGTSNTHPLCVQLLACPKNFNFHLHAHPNVELDIPIVGDLWERRPLTVRLPADDLRRDEPAGTYEGKFFSRPAEEELKGISDALTERTVFEDRGEEGTFVNRVARQGQVIYNEIGSVHQSYTRDSGCLILVLWSGVHARFAEGNFRQKTGVDDVVLD